MPPKKKRPATGPPPDADNLGGPSGHFPAPSAPIFNPGVPLFVPPPAPPPMFVSLDQHLQLAKMLEVATNTINSLVTRVTELEKSLATKAAAPAHVVIAPAPAPSAPAAPAPSWTTVVKKKAPKSASPPAPSKTAAPSLTLRERTIYVKTEKPLGKGYPQWYESIRNNIHAHSRKPIIQTVSISKRKNIVLTTLPNVSARSVFAVVEKAFLTAPKWKGRAFLDQLTWQAEVRAVPTSLDLTALQNDFVISNPHLKLAKDLRWLNPNSESRATKKHSSIVAEIVRPDLTSPPPSSVAMCAYRFRVRLLTKKAPQPTTPGDGGRGKGKGVVRMEVDVRK